MASRRCVGSRIGGVHASGCIGLGVCRTVLLSLRLSWVISLATRGIKIDNAVVGGSGEDAVGAEAEAVRVAWERGLGPVRAFLPERVPLTRLPPPFQAYLDLSRALPEHYPAEDGGVRQWLEASLPEYGDELRSELAQLPLTVRERLMTCLSALGHTYRWHTVPPAPERLTEAVRLPDALAHPWSDLARLLGVPRVGSAWNLLVCNWRSSIMTSGSAYRPDQLSVESLNLAEQWLPPPYDEQLRHFSLLFVMTEAVGAAALPACAEAIAAASRRDADRTAAALEELCAVIDGMRGLLARYLRSPLVEPTDWLEYIQPTFPWAVDGDGLSGPNGLQIATIQAIDATLGIPRETPLAAAAALNRQYLPPAHRRVLAAFDSAGSVLASFASESRSPTVKWRYNECLKALRSWRLVHLKRGVQFLRGASGAGPRVSTGVGLQTRASPASDAAPAAVQDAAGEFEELAADRIREAAAARVVAPPQLAEISSDDIAFVFLSADDRASLLAGCPIRRYARGETLIEQGKIRQPLILLESGTARIVIDGVMLEHVRMRAGDVAGEISFIDKGPASASVIADDDVEATVLSHDHIHHALAGHPELAARLYRSLALLMAQRIRRTPPAGAEPARRRAWGVDPVR